MSHLSPERLAALLDEQPTAGELAHLAACRPCSRERGAYEALAAMSKTGPAIGTPLTSWDKLAPALVRDGVIDNGRGFGRGARISRRWLQAAAAVLLMAGGMALGRMTAADAGVGVTSVATLPTEPRFSSIEEARELATQSQNLYQASMAYLAGQDTAAMSMATPAIIKARLAALEQVTQIVGAALEETPYDPVVNTLYLNAQGQREASMRMLNTASTRLTTY
jgi:hypothetical protein